MISDKKTIKSFSIGKTESQKHGSWKLKAQAFHLCFVKHEEHMSRPQNLTTVAISKMCRPI
jgi:hypothetical protein